MYSGQSRTRPNDGQQDTRCHQERAEQCHTQQRLEQALRPPGPGGADDRADRDDTHGHAPEVQSLKKLGGIAQDQQYPRLERVLKVDKPGGAGRPHFKRGSDHEVRFLSG